jgi:hypothetical protein
MIMKINFSQIYEGWKNNLFPDKDLRKYIKDISEERMAVCEDCALISTKHKTKRPDVHCTDCGCTLSAKTKCLSCECPLKKWEAVISSRDEEEALKKEIYGK